MTDQEAHAQAFENGRQQGDKEGYERGLREAAARNVRESEWVNGPDGDPVCKACGLRWFDDCQECGLGPHNTRYCPGCGARMKGGADHDR